MYFSSVSSRNYLHYCGTSLQPLHKATVLLHV